MPMPKGFVFFYDYEDQLSRLSDSEVGILIRALSRYGSMGEMPELDDPALMVAFDFMKSSIDRGNEQYLKRCETNRKNRMKAKETYNS